MLIKYLHQWYIHNNRICGDVLQVKDKYYIFNIHPMIKYNITPFNLIYRVVLRSSS